MTEVNSEDSMLTYRQVAAFLGVPLGTLYSWVHANRIPHVRFGPRLVRFSRGQVLSWVAKRSVTEGAQ